MTAVVTGKPRIFWQKFKFVVEIDGVAYSGFQDCSEISGEFAKIEQWEGGSLIAKKSSGRLTFADVTLNRGATNDEDLYTWWKSVGDAVQNGGLTGGEEKRNVDIVQQDKDASTLARWRLNNAFPLKFVGGAWDNNADENVMESVTLTFDYFELIKR